MEKVRIGNDMRVNFSVYRNGEPESFDGASNIVTKLVNEAYNKLITHTYTIAGNIVQFDIDALQLTQCGKCRLFISYTKGGDYTVDSPAFELVNYTDQTGGTEIIGVEIVSVNISGDIGINRDGLSAYEVWESYPGNEGKTIEEYFTWLRENPTKIDLNGLNSNIDKLHFNPDTLVQLANVGDVRYSTESRTLEVKVSDTVSIQLGQEMQTRVKNNAGVQINNGQMVYIDSAAGANPLAKIASTANADIAQRTFGMATENIANNGFGAITTEGLVRDVNTAAFTEGDMLWLGINGAVTNIEPVAPTPKISVGMVLRSNVANGVVYVKIRAISRNQKLSDVYAPTLTGGDILRWNSTTLRFETFNVTTALAGKADLVGGKIPTSQLPAYVDDVLEYANLAAFPATGETGKIYVALDTNLTYRWSGTAYVEISKSLALGETSSTAYRGDRGKTAYDHSQATGNAHGTTASQIPNTPAGTVAATTVQGAINELAGDIVQVETDLNEISSHVIDVNVVNFIQGGVINGVANSDTTRIRTDYIKVYEGQSINVVSNGQNWAIKVYDANKVYIPIKSIDWQLVDGVFNVDADWYVIIVISKKIYTNILPSELAADVSILKIQEIIEASSVKYDSEGIISSNVDELISSIMPYNPHYSANLEDISPELNYYVDSGSGYYRIRVRSKIYIRNGDIFTLTVNPQYGFFYGLGIKSEDLSAYLQSTPWGDGNTQELTSVQSDGYYYINIDIKKLDGVSEISIDDAKGFIEKLEVLKLFKYSDVHAASKIYVDELFSDRSNKIDGNEIPMALSTSALLYANGNVSTPMFTLPSSGCRIRCINNTEYSVAIKNYNTLITLGNAYIKLPLGNTIYAQIIINGVKSAQEAKHLLESGLITILYRDDDPITCNLHNESYIKNILIKNYGDRIWEIGDQFYPTFAHISDMHGDVIRTDRAYKLASGYNIDVMLNTGDAAEQYGDDGTYKWDIASRYDIPTMFCVGNHEIIGRPNNSNTDLYNRHISGLHELYGYSFNVDDTDRTYYLKDVVIKGSGFRIISFNQYMISDYNTNGQGWITQTQMDWFIESLKNTPENYGVIILTHANDTTYVDNTILGTSFYHGGGVMPSGQTGSFMSDAVDAFIGKTSVNKTITMVSGGQTQAINVSGDFSSVSNGVEFLFYASGHLHYDCIGYIGGTAHKQLLLGITLGTPLYSHYSGELAESYRAQCDNAVRGGVGSTQDAVNFYAIDKTLGVVRIARVGANMTYDFADRKHVIAAYR